MRCPICKEKVNELEDVCPNCKTNFEEYEKEKRKFREVSDGNNAERLNVMAYINLILSIIGAICIWINFSKIEVLGKYDYITGEYSKTTQTNWYGIFGGIGVIIAGLTLFFLLKTIVDIYWKVGE